ncbi:fibronectin type III-like domain-contianing protein [uncultured Sphingorhabdus sp.]|uniref:fibronectin type III-like domain-contianing protein n=1 Tax=uncultured Sphingorhabdus sp. TaxID=1686106 RepID=UPI00261681CB|nr:fibronectin type III-like domain-contianing protein [uncultured Sphingorhabdus sp.]HMS20092.1 fibronectin type III-like domain-contianing protein [Sphingorhabdus sp.]
MAFPFGHGLSYTSFAVGKPQLTFDEANGRWIVSARVSNNGKRSGAEVVQVYLQLPESANSIGAMQPPRRLVSFQRIELAPGASCDVSIAIDPKASNHPLSVWDEVRNKWVIPQGRYTVWVGRSSSTKDLARAGHFTR